MRVQDRKKFSVPVVNSISQPSKILGPRGIEFSRNVNRSQTKEDSPSLSSSRSGIRKTHHVRTASFGVSSECNLSTVSLISSRRNHRGEERLSQSEHLPRCSIADFAIQSIGHTVSIWFNGFIDLGWHAARAFHARSVAMLAGAVLWRSGIALMCIADPASTGASIHVIETFHLDVVCSASIRYGRISWRGASL